jgi:hypothetical protein
MANMTYRSHLLWLNNHRQIMYSQPMTHTMFGGCIKKQHPGSDEKKSATRLRISAQTAASGPIGLVIQGTVADTRIATTERTMINATNGPARMDIKAPAGEIIPKW